MIKILKQGKLPPKTKTVFKKKCNKCGTEFEFETNDCEYIDRSIDKRFYSIKCPFCKDTLMGSNIYDLEFREEIILEGGE